MEENQQMGRRRWHHGRYHRGAASGMYGLGFVGALVYYLQTAVSFGDGVFGVLKAIVWPAILVYKLLEYLSI